MSISLASGFPLTWQLKHEAFHAVIETLGCMLALGIAGFLLMRQGEKGNEYKLWLACSMLSMAILDALHASLAPGCEFICLHSTAQFIGGVFVDETTIGTEDIWWILEGQYYPRLWWELIPEN